jgi:uncharacterized membrane protein
LKIPKGTDMQTIKAIAPQFYCYLLSFVFVGVYWVNHHHLVHTARGVSAGILWGNMHLLFWLSLIPFATGWMSENNFDKIAVAVYGGLLLMCGIAYTILSKAIKNTHKETTELTKALEKSNPKALLSTMLYASSVPIALFVNPWISEAIFLLVAIIWIVPSKAIEQALENEHR